MIDEIRRHLVRDERILQRPGILRERPRAGQQRLTAARARQVKLPIQPRRVQRHPARRPRNRLHRPVQVRPVNGQLLAAGLDCALAGDLRRRPGIGRPARGVNGR